MKKLIFLILIILLGCKSDDEKPAIDIDALNEILVYDAGNATNSSDIYLTLRFSPTNVINQARIVIGKSSDLADFTSSDLSSLSSDRYQQIMITAPYMSFSLDAGLLDISGNALTAGVQYKIRVIAILNEAMDFFKTNGSIFLTNGNPLAGKYTGTWNDNFYSNFPISTALAFANNQLIGPFYYTASFQPCCGGSNDGTIYITLDGTTITSFTYNQDLLTYMGGCPGTYTGDGKQTSPIQITIAYTGDDCDGHHTDGTIVLTRKPE